MFYVECCTVNLFLKIHKQPVNNWMNNQDVKLNYFCINFILFYLTYISVIEQSIYLSSNCNPNQTIDRYIRRAHFPASSKAVRINSFIC